MRRKQEQVDFISTFGPASLVALLLTIMAVALITHFQQADIQAKDAPAVEAAPTE